MPVPKTDVDPDTETDELQDTEGTDELPELPACFDSLVTRNLVNAQIADALSEVDPTYRDVTIRHGKSALPLRKPLMHLFPDFLTGVAAEVGAVGLVRATIEPGAARELPVNFVFMLQPELVRQLLPQQETHDPATALGAVDLASLGKDSRVLLPLLAQLISTQQQTAATLKTLEAQFVAPWTERSRRFEELMATATLKKLERWVDDADREPVTMEAAVDVALGTVTKTMEAAARAGDAMRKMAPDGTVTPKDLIALAKDPNVHRSVGRGIVTGLKVLGAKNLAVNPQQSPNTEHREYADVPEDPGQTKSLFSAPVARDSA